MAQSGTLQDTTISDDESDWWTRWRKADFSWVGLGRKGLQGWVVVDGVLRKAHTGQIYGQPAPDPPTMVEGRHATLQDYWRADPSTGVLRSDEDLFGVGELCTRARAPHGYPTPGARADERGEAELYHVIHLPLQYADGAETGKRAWPEGAMKALLQARLEAAGPTKWWDGWFGPEIDTSDDRARLDGGVFNDLLTRFQEREEALSVSLNWIVTSDTDFIEFKFSGHLIAENALFLKAANLNGLQVEEDAIFSSARFCGRASFEEMLVGRSAIFSHTRFSEYVSFSAAKIGAQLVLFRTTMRDDVSWANAQVSGDVEIKELSFPGFVRGDNLRVGGKIDSTKSNFAGGVDFSKLVAGAVDFSGSKFGASSEFEGAVFGGDADFSDCSFFGNAGFSQAAFAKRARFEHTSFSETATFFSARFGGAALFDGARFQGRLICDGGQFADVARFPDVRVTGPASFRNTSFSGAAQMPMSTFADLVWFDGARFLDHVEFGGVVFEKPVSFKAIAWPDAPQFWHSAFEGVLFRGAVNLQGAGFKAFAAMDGAILERGIRLDETDEAAAKATFQYELAGTRAAAAADAAALTTGDWSYLGGRYFNQGSELNARAIAKFRRMQQEVRLRELERGCRVLKQAMERSSDRSREQMLYRFELRARRKQRNLPFGEKSFSAIYATVSDYGASIWLPVVWLIVVSACFALTYAQVSPERHLAVVEGAQFSAARVFPFGPFEHISERWLQRYEIYNGKWGGLCLRLLASLQTAFAILMVFLSGLALRRRFQIS